MKEIKRLVLIVLVLFICGCDVEYDLTINIDSSVNEKVIATENTNRMKAKTNLNEKQSINYLYNIYKRQGIDANMKSRTDDNNTIVTTTAGYNSIEEFRDNFYSDIFEEVSITSNDDVVSIEAAQSKKIDSTSSRGMVYDSIKINIDVPFVVTYNNADSISGTTYTWYIKKDEDLKTISLKYKNKELKNAITLDLNNKVYNIKYEFIAILLIVLILAVTILFIYRKNRKNNKI